MPALAEAIPYSVKAFLCGRENSCCQPCDKFLQCSARKERFCHEKSAAARSERMTRERHDNHVIVRTGPIYGPDAGGQWDRRVRTLLASLERGERVVRSGNVFRTFVHVEDLASALAELLDSEWRGTLHLGPGGRESYWSFCRKMARRFGFDPAAIEENVVTPEEAAANGILLDTTLDTRKAQALLATRFRSVDE
jgi:dTDP-4-dehydrorhamnose reductase